jgi:signal peptidase I
MEPTLIGVPGNLLFINAVKYTFGFVVDLFMIGIQKNTYFSALEPEKERIISAWTSGLSALRRKPVCCGLQI